MKINIEIFYAPYCDQCSHARAALKHIVEDIGGDLVQWRAVNVVEEIDYAVQLGVLSTPVIAIDGVLVITALPNPEKLRKLLEDRLQGKSGRKPVQ